MTLLIFSLLGGGYYKRSSMRIIIRVEILIACMGGGIKKVTGQIRKGVE